MAAALLLLAAVALFPVAVRAADLEVWPEGRASIGNKTYVCALGRAGVKLDKREGDGATPAGSYRLRQVLFRQDKIQGPIQTGLPLRAVARDDGWCDDPGHSQYNRLVKLPLAASHEELWRRGDRRYDLLVVVGYNDDPVIPGKGSAIFIHIALAGYETTSGCIAFSKQDLLEIIKRLDANSRVVIHPAQAAP
ncbi:ErfK/YbiS/YcfS/YnhG family protein [Desulfocarbo indianensis]|nr:ErfK/YbiS/YcfS/YnhG family protein [Desulfocarbo indianensis]